jgi:glycosyltransferase involved in cell wall biosynthesis
MGEKLRLAIVIPAKNEEGYIDKSVGSVIMNVKQLRGRAEVRVIVVDDASTDKTPIIAKKYADKYDFIDLLQLKAHRLYDPSLGVVRTVRAGLSYLSRRLNFEWDVFIQVDADTILLNNYINNILLYMTKHGSVGVAGGVVLNEPQARFHVPNTGMAVRREVWDDCGGYEPVPAPDTAIQLCALARGWRLGIVKNAKMILLRPTRINPYKSGFMDGATGGSPLYSILKSARRSLTAGEPDVKWIVSYMSGFISGRLNRKSFPFLAELERQRKLIEKYRLKALLKGKYLY